MEFPAVGGRHPTLGVISALFTAEGSVRLHRKGRPIDDNSAFHFELHTCDSSPVALARRVGRSGRLDTDYMYNSGSDVVTAP